MSKPKGGRLELVFAAIVKVSLILLASVVVIVSVACKPATARRGLPSEVETAIGTVSDDIRQERYEKIYAEAAELWRRDSTAEQSTDVFKTLRTKLGRVESRTLHTAIEQNNSGGTLKGEAYIVTYRTTFERGEGMETFTLTKENGRWLLARYLVNSTALK